MSRPPGFSLYHYDGCPYCSHVLETLGRLGLEVELRDIHRRGAFRRELVRATGRATVPCLRIEAPTGEVLWMPESAEIIEYLEERFAGRSGA